MSNPFEDAQVVLRRTRQQLAAEIQRKAFELSKIDAALAALEDLPASTSDSVPPIPAPPAPTPSTEPPKAKPATFKDAVLDALVAHVRPMSVDEIRRELEVRGMRGQRTEKQLNNTIRSALFSLRQSDLVRSVAGGRNIAAQHADAWAVIEDVEPHHPHELPEDTSGGPVPDTGHENHDHDAVGEAV